MNRPTIYQRWLLMRAQRAHESGSALPMRVQQAAARDAAFAQILDEQGRLDALLRRSAGAQRDRLALEKPSHVPLCLPATAGTVTQARGEPGISAWAWLGPIAAAAVLAITAIGWWSNTSSLTPTPPTTAQSDGDANAGPMLSQFVEQARSTRSRFSEQLASIESVWQPQVPTADAASVVVAVAAAGEDPLQREWVALRHAVEGTVRKVAGAVPTFN